MPSAIRCQPSNLTSFGSVSIFGLAWLELANWGLDAKRNKRARAKML